MNPFRLFRKTEPRQPMDQKEPIRLRGWHIAGTPTKDGFIVTLRRGCISATFRAPTEGSALCEAAKYAEATA